MKGLTRSRIRALVTVHGVYAALLLSALALPMPQLIYPLWITVSGIVLLLVVIEVITFVCVYHLVDHAPAKVPLRHAEFTLDVEAIQVRYGTGTDMPGIESVYLEWFSDELSIDDTEFVAIMQRGGHVRIAEYLCADGTRKIEGYYSVWPLSRETYDGLKLGEIAERDLHSGMILPVNSPEAEVLYISEICALSDKVAKSMLIKDMQRYAKHLLKRSSALKVIATWGYTEIGR